MSLVEVIHNSAYAAHIRESQYIYPLMQCVHITGLAMFAGGVALVNARVAGLGASVPLVDLGRHAMRVAWIGLALIVLTGVNMAASFLEVFAVSTVMQFKLGLVLLALANAVVLQRGLSGAGAPWAASPPDPAKARKWAALGVTVLMVIITLGKLLAYIGGKD